MADDASIIMLSMLHVPHYSFLQTSWFNIQVLDPVCGVELGWTEPLYPVHEVEAGLMRCLVYNRAVLKQRIACGLKKDVAAQRK